MLYIFVVLLALSPRVSEYYYSYYIERSTELSPYEQRNIDRGDPVFVIGPHDSDFVRFSGWSEAKGGNRWSLDDDASVYFRLPNYGGVDGKIFVSARYFSDQKIVVLLNGVHIKTYRARGEMEVLINLDPEVFVSEGENKLQFFFSNASRPEGPDQRRLAMGIKRISIH